MQRKRTNMQSESPMQTHPPADGDGCPGSATTDTLLPCGLNKTPKVIHRTQPDPRQRTLCCRLLLGRGGAATFAQDLLFQILLPGPSFLLTLVWGDGRNGTSKRRIKRTTASLNSCKGANERCDLSSSSAGPSAPLESAASLQNLLPCPSGEIRRQEL